LSDIGRNSSFNIAKSAKINCTILNFFHPDIEVPKSAAAAAAFASTGPAEGKLSWSDHCY